MDIFINLINDCARESQIRTTDTNNINKIKIAMNREYERLWRSFLWNDVVEIDRELTVSSGADEIVLPYDIDTVIYLTEHSLQRVITPTHLNVFAFDNVDDVLSSVSPRKYTNAGVTGLPAKTTTATKIWIKSDSVNDTLSVRVRGKNSNGDLVTETISVNGTSLIEGSITYQAGEIHSIVKSQLTEGTLTIQDDSGNDLMTLAPREYTKMFKVLRLTNTSDAEYTLYLTGKLKFQKLEYDEDIPKFNSGQALKLYGKAQILKDRGNYDEAVKIEQEAVNFVRGLLEEKFADATNKEDTHPTFVRSTMDLPILNRSYF